MTRGILEFIMNLPEESRNEKKMFKEIVEEMSRPVGFAKDVAFYKRELIFEHPTILEILLEQLQSQSAVHIFGEAFALYLTQNLVQKAQLKYNMQPKWKNRFKKYIVKIITFGFEKYIEKQHPSQTAACQ